MGRLVPVIAVAFIAIVGFLAWNFMDTAEDEELDGTQFEEIDTEDRSKPNRVKNQPSKSTKTTVASDSSSAAAAEMRFATTEDFDESNSVVVHVIDAATKKAMPNVTVHVLKPTPKQLVTGLPTFDTDFIFEFRNKGTHYKADEKGQVRIPDSTLPFWLASELGQSFAKRYIAPPFPGQLTLELKPVLVLKTRVVSAEGSPVKGIRVGLGLTDKESGRRTIQKSFAAYTDDNGMAYLAVIGDEVDPEKFASTFTGKGSLYVRVDGIFGADIGQEIDFDNWPTKTVELTLPATSIINLQVRDLDGSNYKGELRCYARLKQPGTATAKNPSWDFHTNFFGGNCQIPDVETGLNILVVVEALEDSPLFRIEKEIEIDGPQDVLLRFKKKLPVIVGQLMDADGNPIGNRGFSYYNQSNYEGPDTTLSSTTDKAGKFAIPVEWTYFETDRDEFLVIEFGPINKAAALAAKAPLPRKAITSDLDVGDITATPLQQLVAGEVRDLAGEPIIGATIQLALDPLKPVTDGFVRSQSFGRPTTNRFGKFTAYGETNVDLFQITTVAPGYREKTQLVSRNETSASITLTKGASIQGLVSFSNGTSCRRLGVSLVNTKTKSRDFSILRNGPFKFEGLDPGPYKVAISAADLGSKKNVVLGEFELAPEEEKDLGNCVVPFEGSRVQFVFADAKDNANIFEISVCAPNTKRSVATLFVHRLKEEAFLPLSPCDLIIKAEGFRSKTVSSFSGGKLKLELSRGIPVKFSLKNFDAIPDDLEGNFYIETSKGETLLWLKDLVLDSRHYLRNAGTFRVVGSLSRKGDASSKAIKVQMIPDTIEINESNQERNVSLQMDRAILQQAIDKLKK